MKLVVTIVGRDQVGIVAMVSGILAEQRVNIMNVNQNIMDGFCGRRARSRDSRSRFSIRRFSRSCTRFEQGAAD